jgi:polysaccharide biosynthesis protein PslH
MVDWAVCPPSSTAHPTRYLAICPIRFGAGTLNKAIEPMAMGIPVVSTSISCVGMNLTPIQDPNFASADYQDRNIIFADTPDTFAQSVVNLLKQPELRQTIGAAAIAVRVASRREGRPRAIELVKAEHDWESIVAKLERIYLETIGSQLERQ